MLEIIRLETYDRARYPRFGHYVRPPKSIARVVREVAPLAAITALLQSCSSGGPTSGVPEPPRLITEAEARAVIDSAFATEDIAMRSDVDTTIHFAPNDSASLSLDGYNDSLKVGYEYVGGADSLTFTPEVCDKLDDSTYTMEPSVLVMNNEYRIDDYHQRLELAVQNFLDS
ncbi:hypothetical protein C3F09_07405, partial [candidate division GN15 bacterium]